MKYIAHKKDGREQTVKEHLENTAVLARDFAVDKLKGIAYTSGLIHDIGKYALSFQDHILHDSAVKYEHATPAAIELGELKLDPREKKLLYMLQYCVMGHHTGLPDGGSNVDPKDVGTLIGRLKRKSNYTKRNDYSAYKDEIKITFPDISELSELLSEGGINEKNREYIERYAFFTRYLFSCLTDADFLDTEKVFTPNIDRELKFDFDTAALLLDKHAEKFPQDTELQRSRTRLLNQALNNFSHAENISILSMPTGSGKTYCSLKLAFEKLKTSGKRRIIYVIPYTSIIEQTAKTMREIFGDSVDILQHHSNYTFEKDEYDEKYKKEIDKEVLTEEKLRRSTENWDAPIIVTTNVQFFQSVYNYKSSALRKMHNLADSVIIFDEVHLLPIELLQPCLRVIGYITRYLNSYAVFLSATMPDYSKLIQAYMPGCQFTELITDKSDYAYYKKCTYHFLENTDYQSVAELSQQYKTSLIVVNKKKTAKEVYKMLSGNKFHLSTYMTPAHRTEIINKIKDCLNNHEHVTVVSTSLIEAGVDLDFKAVFREIAGLDNVLQSGGRCNREGKDENGDVYIFKTEEKQSSEFESRGNIVEELITSGEDISSDSSIKEYYYRLFDNYHKDIDKKSIFTEQVSLNTIPFRKYAKAFKLIDEESTGVVINNCDEADKALNKLKTDRIKGLRALQPYSVSLRNREFEQALEDKIIKEYADGVFILTDNHYYDSETGLVFDATNDIIV